MNSETNVIMADIKTSFVEEYSFWKKIIDELNLKLKNNNLEYQFSYDEFCIIFLDKIQQKLEINAFYDQEIVNRVILELIYEKISLKRI